MKIQIIFNYLEDVTGKQKQGSITFNNIVEGTTEENIKKFATTIMRLMLVQDYKIFKIETKEII